MQVLGVIPARFASTRFPGKPLAEIAGVSMVQRVWDQVSRCSTLTDAVVATEDQRIIDHVQSFGGKAIMTSAEHASGTDRIGEVANAYPQMDYLLNIQGDEPLLDPQAIDDLVRATLEHRWAMSTLVHPLGGDPEHPDVSNPNCVKAVRALDGMALYFSRSPIPYPRDAQSASYLKHIGIYMYDRETLARLCALPRTPLEASESLEQLRAMENGISIYSVETSYNPVAVDVPEDVQRAEERLK
ncbi:MAG: 3-deoxy-manno-octulosonate cytidylyltransferase [Planctomycetales bacterium]|nr:3-deoxy-manno-octulosonate cytidylyltransferase [bacterium]UNM07739.1 MAG: 3-deoxy-manno-octulosonate cytidylyltransferase [Planctomycetales bacterium]